MGENAAPGLISELKLAVPWGHIAAKAWGSLQGPPVLCLHGWLDNANSFDRLIPLLPQDFYYVAMDFGGHGLSSHYSPGVPYYQQTFVSEIRRVVADLKWNRFSILGHSFGGIEQLWQLLGVDILKVFLPVLPGDGVEGLGGQGGDAAAGVALGQAADGAPLLEDPREQLRALVTPDPAVVVVHKVPHAQRHELMPALEGQEGAVEDVAGLGAQHVGQVPQVLENNEVGVQVDAAELPHECDPGGVGEHGEQVRFPAPLHSRVPVGQGCVPEQLLHVQREHLDIREAAQK
uniref:AB hydrolase-1 domain-containing protein n=1 Tax=Piliocolobus tephrosceles TaxID=591936 RepID=A0A8C9HD83_9PRIM